MTVTAVCLYADRPEFLERLIQCFRSQTFTEKRLLIYDNGKEPVSLDLSANELLIRCPDVPGSLTVGELRNRANAHVETEIIVHADSDDYSHPNRIEEQVALLQASGAEAVGYNQMLFWREPVPAASDPWSKPGFIGRLGEPGEAWLYTGSGICGTSLCYWRSSWERKHFEAMNNGEDTRFLMGMKTAACSSIVDGAPRMVARIHSGNTSNAYRADVMRAVEKQGGEWKRVSEWDEHCRRAFA